MSTEVSGALMIGTGVDTSGIETGAAQIEQSLVQLGERASTAGASISEAFANIPTVTNIDFNANFSSVEEAGNYIGEMYAEVYRVIRLNQEGLNELSVKYKEAAKAADMYRNVPSMQEKYKEAVQQKDALKQLIDARKEAIAQAQKQEQELGKVEKKILANAQATEKAANTTTNLRTRIRELTMEAAALRDAAQQQGTELDKTTGRYREIIEEIGRLKDIQGDIQSAGSVFANDENQFAGMLSGLNGLVGGFTAAQGAIALFGAENEDLQKIMLKVQSLMSITMGLQQVQQTLNKDSAFSLVTLNSLKAWWNKLLIVGAGAQATETAATEAHIAAATGDAVAETADAAATEAAAVAKQTKAAASGEAAVAEGVDTVATGANAVAAGAGATANIGLAGAFRMVGAAIASIPVFGWIAAAIGVLIGVISHFVSESNKMEEQVKEKNELLKDSREAYIKAKVGIDDYTRRIDNFNGTAAEEKALVEKLNSEYGAQMGMHKTLAEWKDTLAAKGEAYCRALEQEAVAQAYLNKYVEANIHLLEVQESIKSGKYHHWYNTKYGDQKADDDARRAAEAEVERYRQEYEAAMAKANSIRQEGGLNLNFDLTPTPTPKGGGKGSGGSSMPTFDAKAAAREQRKALEDYVADVKGFIRDANATVSDYQIQMSAQGLGRELMQIRVRSEQRIAEWKRTLQEQAELKKQLSHDLFMTQKGATEDKWEASEAGKMSIEDYMKQFLHGTDLSAIVDNIDLAKQLRDRLQDDDPAKAWLERYVAEVEFAEFQANEMRQKYYDQWVQDYGTSEQKIEALTVKYTKILNSVPSEFHDQVHAAWDAAVGQIKLSDLKKELNWQEVFGNLDRISSASLASLKKKLQDYIKTNKDLTPEGLKEIVDAIEKIDDKLTERNPFDALGTSLDKLVEANKKVKAAQEAYNDALKNGTDEEKANAKAALEAAKNVKQKALVDATDALKSTVSQIKEVAGCFDALVGTLETFGVEIPEQLSGFLGGLGDALGGLESMDLTRPFSIITGAFKAIGGIGKAIGSLFNNDGKKEKNIQKLQKQIDNLQDAYDKLGKSVDKVYSKDASKMIEQQNQMLQQQKILIQNQIREEESKKHTDNGKIDEWRKQIEEINELIAENKEKAKDAIFGEDLKASIENFASAYADAWAAGEDRAKSAKDVVRSMMKKMVTEAIKAAIQASGAMERIRNQLESFFSDNILSDWEQNYIMRMAEDLQKELDQKFGWADSLLTDDVEREGTQKGIATASQDSVDENNARLTTIQGHTYTLVQGLTELNRTSTAILDKVAGIEENTAKSAETLEDVSEGVKKLRNSVDEIQQQGIKIRP